MIVNFDRDMQGPGLQKCFCFYAGFSEEAKRGLNEAENGKEMMVMTDISIKLVNISIKLVNIMTSIMRYMLQYCKRC